MINFAGIEIGGSKIQHVVGDDRGKIIRRYRSEVGVDKSAESIRQNIRQTISDIQENYTISAIGIGFGGPVDHQNGIAINSFQVKGWNNFHLKEWLFEMTGLPAFIENDANTAAIAESLEGAGRGFERVFYITLGSGVGGGFVINGEIYHGHSPGESEIGHVRLSKDGTKVEDRCSGWAVNRKIRNYIGSHPDSSLAARIPGTDKPESEYLPQALEEGDPAAWDILRETANDLAFALSHVVHLYHPDVLVLGGGLALIGEPLRALVAEILPGFLIESFPLPLVRLSELGEDVVPVGTLLIARRNYFKPIE